MPPANVMPSFAAPSTSTSFASLYSSLAVFLLGAIALVVESGYVVGAALLVLGGLTCLPRHRDVAFTRDDGLIIGVLLLFGAIHLLDIVMHQAGMRALDKPLGFILAVFAFVLARKYPPRLSWLWGGLAVGGVLLGCLASYEKFILEYSRARGYINAIQFGNIALLIGLFCVAGLGWARVQQRRMAWTLILMLGSLGGILASFLSGTRGGWVGIPFMLLVLYLAYGEFFTRRARLITAALIVGGLVLVYNTPQLAVQQRVDKAIQGMSQYLDGESRTSVGLRFEMWKGAAKLFLEKPVLGWGESNYKAAMNGLIDQGRAYEHIRKFDHAHNELLDNAAKQGLPGALALLALYLVPLCLFARSLRAPDLTERALATAGVLLPVAYISFGLTQAFFWYVDGVIVYAFWLAVLWGCWRNWRD